MNDINKYLQKYKLQSVSQIFQVVFHFSKNSSLQINNNLMIHSVLKQDKETSGDTFH